MVGYMRVEWGPQLYDRDKGVGYDGVLLLDAQMARADPPLELNHPPNLEPLPTQKSNHPALAHITPSSIDIIHVVTGCSSYRRVMEGAVLAAVGQGNVESLSFANAQGFDHQALIGVLKSLLADGYVKMDAVDHEGWKLTDEGEACVTKGSPEAQVFALVKDDGSDKDEIEKLAGALAKVGLSQCMQSKWLRVDKAQVTVIGFEEMVFTVEQGGKIFKETASIEDVVQKQLSDVKKGVFPSKADLDKLKKRKVGDLKLFVQLICSFQLITAANYKTYNVTKGPDYAPVRTKAAADITAEMIADGR
eukprot:763811-Hanusia_phi.AAC.9